MPPRTRTPKPKAHDETVRVLRIYDWLAEELGKRQPWESVYAEGALPSIRTLPPIVHGNTMLAVAERIAARTED